MNRRMPTVLLFVLVFAGCEGQRGMQGLKGAPGLQGTPGPKITREWWDGRREFELYVSQLVLDEAAAGDTEAATRRLASLREVALLDTTEEAIALGRHLVATGGLPPKAGADALHIAVAAVHGLDFLLTWNCTHIANARMRGRIEELCRRAGYVPPMLCTPMELMEE